MIFSSSVSFMIRSKLSSSHDIAMFHVGFPKQLPHFLMFTYLTPRVLLHRESPTVCLTTWTTRLRQNLDHLSG